MNRRCLLHHRRGEGGMTLLEVVMALFIFTLVAFSMVRALDVAFDAAKERNEIDRAVIGLENQIALLHMSQLVPIDKDLPDDGSGVLYHVTVGVEQMQDQKNQPVGGMLRATITATWQSEGQTEQRSVSELIYQP